LPARLTDIAPVMARAAVAAEDADFCLQRGFDMIAIRAAIAAGGRRGASTITRQVVKNVRRRRGRSWARKALEAVEGRFGVCQAPHPVEVPSDNGAPCTAEDTRIMAAILAAFAFQLRD